MAGGVRAPERMSRRELLAEVKRLRAAPVQREPTAASLHDLHLYEETLAIQRDQLVEAQRQLEHSRDIYADLYDYAPLPYVTLDEYGIIRNINLTGAQLLGCSRSSVDRRPFSRFVDDKRRFLEHMRRCRREDGPVTSNLTLALANGEAMPVQLTTRKSVPPGSEEVEYRTAIVDLRMLRAAEAARARAESDRRLLMREEERLRDATEAKDEFLAVLSHELRTPLTPILAVASALQAHADLPQPIRDGLQRIQRNVEVETRLIDDLLDLTRAARGTLSLERKLLDLHQVLRDTVELCEADRPRGVVITWSLGASEHHVQADPVRLGQVFWNLVRNAFQGLGKSGDLLIRSTNDAPGRITVALRDSGCGIDGADLERIFLPFYQPRGDGRGRLGLGLTIAKSLVDGHGGLIRATSPGRGLGACFEIELDVSPAVSNGRPGQAAETAPAPEVGAGPDRLAILLVEDNEDSAAALSEALRLDGFDVRLAGSVAAAREEARQRFDVLVSDLALPDGSGLDLIAELRKETAVPAIALSGFGSERDKRTSVAAGFSAHLTKPVTIARLSETIRGLVPPTGRRPDQAG
jgi:PAS domain S-box-containing protein